MKRSTPMVRHRDAHNISRKLIDPDALKVLYRLHRQGYAAYLCGGGVRDLLLGRRPKDFDIATDAHPNKVKRLFRNGFLIGRRFRLVHVRFGDKVIEVSTFRRKPDPEHREDGGLFHVCDNTFGTPEEDAFRRDFTINAMFYNIADFSVIDFCGGLKDLKRRSIRCIGDPNERFPEDPVRMLRAVRFAARMDFSIESRSWRAIRKHRAEIAKTAQPRLLEEIYKLFGYRSGEAAFRLLRKSGMFEVIFPSLERALGKRKAREAFWKLFAALDAHAEDFAPPKAEHICAALIAGQVDEALAAHDGAENPRVRYGLIRDQVQAFAQQLGVPKRVTHHVVRILEAQRRFESPVEQGKGRFSRRKFASTETFVDALEWFRIRTAAGSGDVDALANWDAWWKENRGKVTVKPDPDAPERRRRRPRRRRPRPE